MKAFHLQARRLVGPLSAPLCDDRRLADSDSRDDLSAEGRALAATGFTVWIFRRTPGGTASTGPVLRLVDRFDPPDDPGPGGGGPAPRSAALPTPPSTRAHRRPDRSASRSR